MIACLIRRWRGHKTYRNPEHKEGLHPPRWSLPPMVLWPRIELGNHTSKLQPVGDRYTFQVILAIHGPFTFPFISVIALVVRLDPIPTFLPSNGQRAQRLTLRTWYSCSDSHRDPFRDSVLSAARLLISPQEHLILFEEESETFGGAEVNLRPLHHLHFRYCGCRKPL